VSCKTMLRPWFSQPLVQVVALAVTAAFCQADGFSPIRVVGREMMLASPRPGVRMMAMAYYTQADGAEMMRLSSVQTRSDKLDIVYESFSADNGRTWSAPRWLATHTAVEGGMLRRTRMPGFVDPVTGVLVQWTVQGVLPTDHPLEGMKHWTLWYRLSRDGGRSFYHEGPVIQQGDAYDVNHPMDGVWVGRNSVMIGDSTCVPIRTRAGLILQPIQITPVGPDGQYHNPGGGLTYHDSAVLIGRWNEEGTLDWDLSGRVAGDPQRTTRGMIEPTIAEMGDGRILMVMRGSNDRRPELPGYRWYAVSTDGGRTFTDPQPWTCADGEPFHSPSACSQLVPHSNGQLYWIGNISASNPRGNAPRYPLVIGQVDAESLLLRKQTVVEIENRAPDEPAWVSLSNFYAHEDRVSGDILVYLSPIGKPSSVAGPASAPAGSRIDFTADAWVYRVAVAPAR